MDFHDIRWPVYAIAQRENAADENGVRVVMEFGLLLSSQVSLPDGSLTGSMGLLLFSSAANAEQFIAAKKVPACVVATFRDKNQLRDCVQHYKDQKHLVVLFDRGSDGQFIEIDMFLSIVERQC